MTGRVRKSYHHRGGDIPLLGNTIPEHFAAIAAHHADREAVVCAHQNQRLTYAELSAAVDRLARGLIGIGFGAGDRIGIWSTNNLEWLLLQLATARIGAILVNINPAYRADELAYALRQAEVQCLFTMRAFRASDYVQMLVEAIPELKGAAPAEMHSREFPSLQRVVVFDPSRPAELQRPHHGFTLWSEVMQAAATVPMALVDTLTRTLDADDPINIQYTSGTTGFPKAVVLSHHNILNNAYFAALAMRFGAGDRLCVPVPFYHCFGMVLANLLCLSVGACVVVPSEHFDAEATLESIERERCSAVHGVPTMFIAQLEHPRFGDFDLSSLRTGIMAGAPCPPALMKRVIEDMHCGEILIGYGETEASPLTHLTDAADAMELRIETVGRNLPHQEVKIIDVDSRRTVRTGAVGEICFRGYHVMHGYYNNTQATREVIDQHGWLHSGDLGSMDENGYVRITGRLKDLVIRGGENIYPREIEDLLFTHPKVAEVAVFGVPDDYYGEELMAWIQLHAGETAGEEEIRDFCKDKLAHYKVPRHIWFVEDFPMTVTGKLQKFKMREIAQRKLAGD
ncbi:MAG: AMP-binding protein [Gammaproteobacteria bacterium SG8_47]|nr:MAG: AMP-binding protein [Gammaproteobacteria bacterium SG8_47]